MQKLLRSRQRSKRSWIPSIPPLFPCRGSAMLLALSSFPRSVISHVLIIRTSCLPLQAVLRLHTSRVKSIPLMQRWKSEVQNICAGALLNAAKYVCKWEPTFAVYLKKKLAEGKHYNVAVSHAAKKLVRLLYHLETTGEKYIPQTLS